MRSKKRSQNFDGESRIVLERKLLQWTCERHATNQPLNREILEDKITDLLVELGSYCRNFKCTKSWITRFLKKYGFSPSLATLHGPIFNDYRDWVELMRSCIMQFRYKNVFQVDEMGMYPDTSPDKIPQFVDYTCKNGEYGESRVTILLCCNASGVEKLPPVICGRFENRLPPDPDFQYHTNQNAWLTPSTFKLWLSQLNAQMSQANRKILLMLNRSRLHALKHAVLSNVSLMFFPKEFPPNLQPLRANIFHYVKMMYRRTYAEQMLMQPNFNWTTTDTINSIVNSWNSVPKEFILSSFRRTNLRADNDLLQISCPEWANLNSGIPFRSYVTFDDNLCVSSSPTRRSNRLADIKTGRGSGTSFARASSRVGDYREFIDLGDSDSDEVVVEQVLHSSQISRVGSDLEAVNSYDRVVDGTRCRMENKEIDKARYSKPESRGSSRGSSSRHSQCSKEDRSSDRTDFLCSARRLSDRKFLYISDIVKDAVGQVVDNIPGIVNATSELKSCRSTGDVINRHVVQEGVETASIAKKRCREEGDEEDLPNDESLEHTKKKKFAEKQTWSDIYERNFVFGIRERPQATTSASVDVQTTLLHPEINLIQKNDDLEKKSIFTISLASSSREQNQ